MSWLELALKSTLVLLAAWLLALALWRRSAALRHLVWTGTMAALIALPMLSVVLPALRLPEAVTAVESPVVFQILVTGRAGGGLTRADAAPRPERGRSQESRPFWWVIAVLPAVLIWTQMLVGYAAMSLRRRRARPFATACEVPVLESAPGSMPIAFGLLRPAIFLPSDAVHWTEERRRIVLLHELAHVRRGDAATHLLGRVALGFYWWNPLAWMAWRRLLKESERAADDFVLAAGERASDYAGHLLDVARSMQTAPARAWAGVQMARRSELEGRMLAILDSRINRSAVGRAAPLLATLTAILFTAPFAAMRAQDPVTGTPPEIDATIRAANAQKNHEILERAAAAYEKVKQFDAAQKLLETALTIREETSGKGSGAYVAGLVKLGDLAIARRQYEEAIAFYEKAVSFGDRPEAAPALYHLAWRDKDKTKTYDMLRRVVNVASDKNLAGRALTYLADNVSVQPGRQSEAESMYQRALAMEDHSTDNALITMDHYARFLRSQNRNAEAEAIEKEKVASKLTVDTMPLPPDVYRVGNGVSAPTLLYKVEPEYSPEGRALQQEGTVLLGIVVAEDGTATNVTVVRSLGYELDEKAVEAVKKWKFKPGMKDGVPVPVKASIEVNFRLY